MIGGKAEHRSPAELGISIPNNGLGRCDHGERHAAMEPSALTDTPFSPSSLGIVHAIPITARCSTILKSLGSFAFYSRIDRILGYCCQPVSVIDAPIDECDGSTFATRSLQARQRDDK